jgi:hypothetical protein
MLIFLQPAVLLLLLLSPCITPQALDDAHQVQHSYAGGAQEGHECGAM